MVISFQMFMALVKSARDIRELLADFSAPERGYLSKLRSVVVSKNVSAGIFTGVPSGIWVVLNFVAVMPTSEVI
jgi:hypothetical protein